MSIPTVIDRQLLQGPPDSPLTARVLDELVAELARPSTDPRRVLLLVPNHAAVLNCQRRLQQRTDLAAIPGCIVPLSALPARLGAIAPGCTLPDMLGPLLLRAALHEVEQTLLLAGEEPLLPSARRGVVAAVSQQIRECKQAGYRPDNDPLAPAFPWSVLEHALDPQGATHRLRLLAQFRAVWGTYERLLHAPRTFDDIGGLPGWFDGADQLLEGAAAMQAAPPAIDWLGVDGFHEFTALQWQLLRPLLACPRVRFTLHVDRLEGDPFVAEADPRRWFHAILRQELFFEAIALPSAPTPLAALHRVLPAITSGQSLDDAQRAMLPSPDVLCMRRPRDKAREVASILRSIVRRVQRDPAARFRHHALIVRNLASYRPLLESEALALGIPMRILQPAQLSAHPLAQGWLRTCTLLASHDWSPEAVLGVLQPLTMAPALFRAYGLFQSWLATHPAMQTPHEWTAALAGMPAPKRESCAELVTLLEALLAAQSQFQLSALDGQLSIAVDWLMQRLLPIWREASRLDTTDHGAAAKALAELASSLLTLPTTAFAEELVDGADRLIELALDATTYEPTDRRRDVVRVVDAERARDIEADHLAILGLTLGAWPRRPRPEPFLDDELRHELSRAHRGSGADRHPVADAWTRPDWHTEATSAAVEGWMLRLACAKARQTLTLSAPRWEAEESLEPAPWWSALVRDPNEVASDSDSQLLPPMHDWTQLPDAVAWLACYRHEAIAQQGERTVATRHAITQLGLHGVAHAPLLASRLAARLEAHPLIGPAVARAAHRWPNAPATLSQAYPEWVGRGLSASSLNDLAQCSFKFLAQRVMRLEELRPPLAAGLEPMARGTLMHQTLEQWAIAHPDLDPSALLPLFDAVWRAEVPEGDPTLLRPQRLALERHLRQFLAVESSVTSPWPWEARLKTEPELRFGKEQPVTLTLPDGRTFAFSGSIDRLDTVRFQGIECLVLMDYKTSKKSLKSHEDELLKGFASFDTAEQDDDDSPVDITLLDVDLQLPLYMYAAATLRAQPVLAAFHYPLADPTGRVHAFLPGSGGWGVVSWKDPAQLKLPTADDWSTLMLTLSARIMTLLDRIEASDIHPSPLLRKRCGPGHCAYARLCRFDDQPVRSRW